MPYTIEWDREKFITDSFYKFLVKKNQLAQSHIQFEVILTGSEKNAASTEEELKGWKKRYGHKLSEQNKASIRKFLRTCDIFEQKQKKRKGKNGRITKKNNRVGRKTSNNKLTDSSK